MNATSTVGPCGTVSKASRKVRQNSKGKKERGEGRTHVADVVARYKHTRRVLVQVGEVDGPVASSLREDTVSGCARPGSFEVSVLPFVEQRRVRREAHDAPSANHSNCTFSLYQVPFFNSSTVIFFNPFPSKRCLCAVAVVPSGFKGSVKRTGKTTRRMAVRTRAERVRARRRRRKRRRRWRCGERAPR